MDLGIVLDARMREFGLTLEDAAKRSRVDVERLRALTSGMTPNLDELHRLGRALVFDPYAVVRGDPTGDPARSTARFKRPEGAHGQLEPSDVLLLARSAEIARMGAWLARLLGKAMPLSRQRVVRQMRDDSEPWKQGYDLGGAARDAMAPGRAPVPSIQGLLEASGVHIAEVPLESQIIAVALYESGSMPLILLNVRSPRIQSPSSRRATLAHELCHLLHDGGERDMLTVTERNAPDPFEQRANGFAPAFIAHPDAVRSTHEEAFRSARTVSEVRDQILVLAQKWGFGPKGAIWHAKNCQLMTAAEADEYDALSWEEFTLPSFEPRLPRHEIPDEVEVDELVYGVYSDLVVEAMQRDEISLAKLQELLSV